MKLKNSDCTNCYTNNGKHKEMCPVWKKLQKSKKAEAITTKGKENGKE